MRPDKAQRGRAARELALHLDLGPFWDGAQDGMEATLWPTFPHVLGGVVQRSPCTFPETSLLGTQADTEAWLREMPQLPPGHHKQE